jgi:hypothetical protein
VSLEYRDVSAHIQPETVHIKSLDGDDLLTVMEQNYRYDLLSPQKLLEKYVDKKIKVYRYNEKLGREEMKEAKVLAVEQGTVLEIDGEVTYGFPGRFAFPEVPPNLIAKPSLVWLLGSRRAQQRVEVSYLTKNLNWVADYVMVVGSDDKVGDLSGWVTLTNGSGTSYDDAQLKLVAGDVQRVQSDAAARANRDAQLARFDAAQETPVQGRGLLRVPPVHARASHQLAGQGEEAGQPARGPRNRHPEEADLLGRGLLLSRQLRPGRRQSEDRRLSRPDQQREEPHGHAAAEGHGAGLQGRQERGQAVHR